MENQVDFVQLDQFGIITRERWLATRLHCPRCGKGVFQGAPHVWVRDEAPQVQERTFLCISCLLVAKNINGFQPPWDCAAHPAVCRSARLSRLPRVRRGRIA